MDTLLTYLQNSNIEVKLNTSSNNKLKNNLKSSNEIKPYQNSIDLNNVNPNDYFTHTQSNIENLTKPTNIDSNESDTSNRILNNIENNTIENNHNVADDEFEIHQDLITKLNNQKLDTKDFDLISETQFLQYNCRGIIKLAVLFFLFVTIIIL